MKTLKIILTAIFISLSAIANAEPINNGSEQQDSIAIKTHLINLSFNHPNYQEYALAQAKARWGTDKSYNDEQNKTIKSIEETYAMLDKNYQQQLTKANDNNFQYLLSKENSNDYISKLNEFYATDIGKQILNKQPTFNANENKVLDELPNLISKKISSVSNPQSDASQSKQ